LPKKKTLSAKEVAADIRADATDEFLMKKYGLSESGLQSLFGKLVTGNILTQADLDRRTSAIEEVEAVLIEDDPRPEATSNQTQKTQAQVRQVAPKSGGKSPQHVTTSAKMFRPRNTAHSDERSWIATLGRAYKRHPISIGCLILAIIVGWCVWPKPKSQQLLDACSNGDNTIVTRLLQEGIDINTRDDKGKTSLHYAASTGNLELVQILLRAGADTAAESKEGTNVLMSAAAGGNVIAFQDILIAVNHQYGPKLGANHLCGQDRDYWTPLTYAVNNNRLETVEFLIRRIFFPCFGSLSREKEIARRKGYHEILKILNTR